MAFTLLNDQKTYLIHRICHFFKDIVSRYVSRDILIFLIIISVCNIHLLTGSAFHHLIFYPQSFLSGDWYRLVTFSFVHVSIYHFVLDVGAFLMLYSELGEKRTRIRLLYVICCGIFSLSAATLFSPAISAMGLCGLSGIAHGLMAVSALEMMADRKQFSTGLAYILIIIFKSAYEVITGIAFFAWLHIGDCGTPVAACHAGGVIGGIIFYATLRCFKSIQTRFNFKESLIL